MDPVPEQLQALLESGEPPLCAFCGDHDSKPLLFSCEKCGLECYCSSRCRASHAKAHLGWCRYHGILQSIPNRQRHRSGPRVAHTMWLGDHLIGFGYNESTNKLGRFNPANGLRRRDFFFRKALKTYLECLLSPIMREHGGKAAEPRALCLMVLLGGDAQLLLDWYSYSSSWDAPVGGGDVDDPPTNPAPSLESQQQSRYPLLALHGLFDQDTEDPNHSVFCNMYLLACFRSLARHRQLVQGFQTYREICSLPPEAVQDHVASFLWKNSDMEYGNALSAEIRRVVQHLLDHKREGRMLLRQLCRKSDDHDNNDDDIPYFTQEGAPNLLRSKHANGISRSKRSIWKEFEDWLPHDSMVPALWILYQECFQQAPNGMDLAEFLPPNEELAHHDDKKKKD